MIIFFFLSWELFRVEQYKVMCVKDSNLKTKDHLGSILDKGKHYFLGLGLLLGLIVVDQ